VEERDSGAGRDGGDAGRGAYTLGSTHGTLTLGTDLGLELHARRCGHAGAGGRWHGDGGVLYTVSDGRATDTATLVLNVAESAN
jgi:hypothetical protein